MNLSFSTQNPTNKSSASGAYKCLSVRLREETRLEHKLVEAACRLPNGVQNLSDYKKCLLNFYGIIHPLEQHIATFSKWENMGLYLQKLVRTPDLKKDLRLMNVNPKLWRKASVHALPSLPEIPFALGALYVLEGSTLGGQIIMSVLKEKMSTPLGIPCGFFTGRGETTGLLWRQFCTILDAYGEQFPETHSDVTEGAKRTFNAIASWFVECNSKVSL